MRRAFAILGLLAACTWGVGSTEPGPPPPASVPGPPATSPTTLPVTTTEVPEPTPTTIAPASTTTTEADPHARPDWLGTRVLPLRPDGHGEVRPTPPELADRRLATVDHLPPPAGEAFVATIEPVPGDVLARSTWHEDCPVGVDQLRYVTVTHHGFDEEMHTGELIVNAEVADDVVEVFRRLHQARFPIEQMRVISRPELDEPPTGDGNVTTGFVCRPAVGSSSWSQHAFGLAIDINPFHNPYQKGDLVLPELASAYTDRDSWRPGMLREGDVVTEAFVDIGWGWGGHWRSLDDWMHFSRSGR